MPPVQSLPCSKCESSCQPLACSANIEASEWYCSKCHKSYKMDRESAEAHLNYEKKQKQILRR